MDQATRLAFGPEQTDLYETINVARMREERAERAREVMREYNVPALLVTGNNNVRYLTGFWWADFQQAICYTLFFADHDPVVFAHAGSFQQGPAQQPWIKEWRIGRSWMGGLPGEEATAEEASKWAGEIADILRERGLADEPLGVVDFDWRARNALTDQGLTIQDGSEILLEASKIKTQDEINCLKMAVTISARGFQRAVQTIRPGVRQSEVAKAMVAAMVEVDTGALQPHAMVFSGPLGFERGLSGGDRIIEYGDFGYVLTCGTSYMGYTCCQYRTYVVGRKANPKEQGWYDALRDCLDAVMSACRPGATTAEVAQHFPPASKWRYKDEAEVLSVEWAHGIGLVSLDSRWTNNNLPAINRQWSLKHPQEIVPGMVIAAEGIEGEHRVGGVRLENMIVVTEEGPQMIDSFPRDDMLEIAPW